MKKVIPIIIFSLIFSNLKSQEIININPDNSTQGESIDLTITGQNAHFIQATNTTLWFSQGSSTILDPVYFDVQNDNSILANFSFSLYDPTGEYNVNVNNSIDGDLALENGFILNAYSTDTFLVSVEPSEAHQNETIGLTISGYNTNFGQASNTIWFNQGSNTVNSNYVYVENDNYIYAEFTFTESNPTGLYDLNVQNSTDGTLLLEDEFTLLSYPKLVSVTPDEANKGDNIELTITGENTNFYQASNTVWFTQGSNTVIYPENTDVVSDSKIIAEFAFFNTYETGTYDVNVYNYLDSYLYLENGFSLNENLTPPQLISISPDKAPRNESITLTLIGQNTNFNQATNVVWLNQGNSTIQADTTEVITSTEIQADFAFSTSDSIGNYNVNVSNNFDGDLYLENSFTLDYGTFISYNELNKILVFPNPTSGDFRIDNIPNLNCTINIINIDGGIIKTYHNNNNSYINISLSNLKGYYFVRISNNDFQVTRKILVF